MACEEKCFTFVWKLENASYCIQKKGHSIESPAFVVNEIDETKWYLSLYPRGEANGNYIGFYLNREHDSKGVANVEIKFDLDFVAQDGSILTSRHPIIQSFPLEEGYGITEFEKREVVFILKRSTYLPEDILTARCRIWKRVGEMTEDVRCFARTRIAVEKRSFVWNLANFSSFNPGEGCIYLIKSPVNYANMMSINLSLIGGQNCEEIIHFKLTRHDQRIRYCALRLSLVNVLGKRIECNQDEFWFDKFANSQQFIFFFSRQRLMEHSNKSEFVPGDILALHWECFFSKGIVSEEIEEVQCGCVVPK